MVRALAVVLLSSAFAFPALAARLVVLDFQGGSRAKLPRADLIGSLLRVRGVELVSKAEFLEEVAEAGVRQRDLREASGIRRASAITAIDAVVRGKVFRSRRAWKVTVELYDASGERVLRETFTLSGGHLRGRDLTRLARRIADALGSGLPTPDDGPALAWPPPEDDPPPPLITGVPGDGTGFEVPLHDDGLDDWANEPFPREIDHTPMARGEPGRSPFVRISATAGGATRRYHLQGPGVPTIDYEPDGLYLEVGALVELFPLATSGRWWEGLGLEAAFSNGFLDSRYVEDGTTTRVATPVRRLHVDLRYRFRFLTSSRYSPVLGPRVGVYVYDFSPKIEIELFGSVHHQGLRLGLEYFQPILPPQINLDVWGVIMPASRTGKEEIAAFGASRSTGVALHVGLSGSLRPIGRGLTWATWIEILRHSDRFEPAGGLGESAAATESYFVMGGTLGYAY